MPPIRTKKTSSKKTDLQKPKSASKTVPQKKQDTQFTAHLFKPEKGATISRMLTCSLLDLFFDDDFLNGGPRSTGFKYFRPQADESHIYHYTEDEDLHLWKLPKDLNIAFIRVTIITLLGSTRPQNRAVCAIALKVGVYDANNAIIEVPGGEKLNQCINVTFWATPGSNALRRCMYWENVVRFLRDAAVNGFSEEGDYAWERVGFKSKLMERVWVDWGIWDKSEKDWIKRWGCGGIGVRP
ncbi:hypothetical protein GLAREA_12399 [Glarea lozoyensis ATCC 20868]|uniref:Uncharacterized protein n=1 Tax=Glarea lozoyensis (strain ATCC 20868 / MF5171) TaxID=1116229 RepID=S3DZ82_GLAL2|nr:uncharacterized protein GLAREA_12399 [Glarea lozoyensis ATCC 20868]EPE31643.1 hypothetical protein GLAREA_12399 [Glarea lozoyensis ATCC 20868]